MPKPDLVLPPQAQPPTPGERGASRVRNLFRRGAATLEQTVRQIHAAIERSGRAEVEAALGPASSELDTLYNSLKAAAEALGAENLPDLPAKSE